MVTANWEVVTGTSTESSGGFSSENTGGSFREQIIWKFFGTIAEAVNVYWASTNIFATLVPLATSYKTTEVYSLASKSLMSQEIVISVGVT